MKLSFGAFCCAITLLIFQISSIANGQEVLVLPENSTVGTLDFGCAPDTEPTILYKSVVNTTMDNIDIKMRIVNDASGGQFVFSNATQSSVLTLIPGETNIELVFLGTTSGSFGATVEIFDFAADELVDDPLVTIELFTDCDQPTNPSGLGRFHP